MIGSAAHRYKAEHLAISIQCRHVCIYNYTVDHIINIENMCFLSKWRNYSRANQGWDYSGTAREKQSLDTSSSEELLQRWAIIQNDDLHLQVSCYELSM